MIPKSAEDIPTAIPDNQFDYGLQNAFIMQMYETFSEEQLNDIIKHGPLQAERRAWLAQKVLDKRGSNDPQIP